MSLTIETLYEGFQVDHQRNPLIGLEDRLELLRHLGQVLQRRADYFQANRAAVPRPGNLMGKTDKWVCLVVNIYPDPT